MLMTPLVYKAIDRAAQLHHGQMRKDGKTPFIVHPCAVGLIVSQYTDDQDTIIAGILHDTIEDVEGYEYKNIQQEFSKNIADIVKGVTHIVGKDWLETRNNYLNTLKNASDQSVIVSCADKIHNIYSSVDGLEQYGESFWNNFVAPPEQHIWFYKEVLHIAQHRLNNDVVVALEKSILQLEHKI